MITKITQQLTAYMVSMGIVPAENLNLAGDICRFEVEGDTPGKRNGWCALNMGEFPFASFGSWKTGKTFTWQLKTPTSPAEIKQAKKAQADARNKYRSDRDQKHKQAAETANILWNKSVPADADHPYLLSKQILPHGIRQLEGALLLPIHYKDGIVSLQAIYQNGQKIFLQGGQVKGCYFPLENSPINLDKIYIGEGYATMATLKENLADDCSLFVAAFTAGNLTEVARGLRTDYPHVEIIICADNDQWTEGNPGMKKGREAALMVGGKVMSPNFTGLDTSSHPTDFNDYAQLGGDLCL